MKVQLQTRAENLIKEKLVIFIVFKLIIIRDAFYSTINRRKEWLLVPTLCAAVGECLHRDCGDIPQTLDTEWNQGCQPSQLQGGEGLWLCHQVLPGTCSGLVVLRVSWYPNTPRPHPSGETFHFFFGSLEADNTV